MDNNKDLNTIVDIPNKYWTVIDNYIRFLKQEQVDMVVYLVTT